MDKVQFLTIDDLVERTQLPKSWWYSRTRLRTGPNRPPVLRCGRHLRFIWPEIERYLKEQNDEHD